MGGDGGEKRSSEEKGFTESWHAAGEKNKNEPSSSSQEYLGGGYMKT